MPSLKARDLWRFSQVPILTNKKTAWWIAGSWTHGYVSIQISRWVDYSLPVPKLKQKPEVRWSLFTWPTVTSWKTLRGVLLGSKSTWNTLHLLWSNGLNFGIDSMENVEGRNQWKTRWWFQAILKNTCLEKIRWSPQDLSDTYLKNSLKPPPRRPGRGKSREFCNPGFFQKLLRLIPFVSTKRQPWVGWGETGLFSS